MKQMTKEELIEYFLEQLGDNEILGRVMTIDEIRSKLNNIIKGVTYDVEIGSAAASWRIPIDGYNTVNFDIKKIPLGTESEVIVHELLHALSTSSVNYRKYKNQKVGLQLANQSLEFGGYLEWNRAINEGMTDYLAEKITRQNNHGYSDEKSIYKILSIVIEEQFILNQYFGKIDEKDGVSVSALEKKANNIFLDDIVKQYGTELGIEINDDIKKVLRLSDQLNDMNSKKIIYGLNENGKRIYSETKKEIYDTLTLILEKIVANEQDLSKLLNIVELVSNTNEIKSKLQKSLYDRIYNLYIENGKISEDKYSKRKIFESVLKGTKVGYTIERLDARLATIKYRQIGEYYEVFGISKKGKLYNSDSLLIENFDDDTLWSFSPDDEEVVDEFDRKKLLGIVDENNISILLEQLKTKAREFNEKNVDLAEISQNNQENYMDVSVLGNLIKLEYGNYYEFYSVNSDGCLNVIEPRRRKKIYR